MSAERLIKEFGAQDTGAFLITFIGGKHEKVAQWIEGNNQWSLLPEGQALLDAQSASVVESVDTSAGEKPARKSKPKAPAEEITDDLGDL